MADKKKRQVLKAPVPTYTKIDPKNNASYKPPSRRSYAGVQQADLMPQQSFQPITNKGALSSKQPSFEPTEANTPMANTFNNMRETMDRGMNPLLPAQPSSGYLMNNLTGNKPTTSPSIYTQKPHTPQQQSEQFLQNIGGSKPYPKVGYVEPTAAATEEFLKNAKHNIPLSMERELWMQQQDRNRPGGIAGPITKGVDVFQAYFPGVAAFQKGAAAAQGTRLNTPPPSSHSVLDKLAYGTGFLSGGAMNPAALEQSLITTPYKVAERLVNKYAPGASNVAQRFIKGLTAGAQTGGAYSLITGQHDTSDIVKNASFGGLLGGFGDVALGAVGSLITRLRSRGVPEQKIKEIVNNIPENANPEQIASIFPEQTAEGGSISGVAEPSVAGVSPEPSVASSEPAQGGRIQNKGALSQAAAEPAPVAATAEAPPVSTVIPEPEQGAPAFTRILPKKGERAFYSNIESTNIPDEELRARLAETNREYDKITNRGTLADANKRIESDLEDAISFATSAGTSAEKIAAGSRAIQELQRAGNYKRAVEVADSIAERLTKAGQEVQAARIIQQLSPEGQLIHFQRRVKALNEKLPADKQITINDETAKKITDIATAAQEANISKGRAAEVLNLSEKLLEGGKLTDDERQLMAEFAEDISRFASNEAPDLSAPTAMNKIKDQRKRDKIVEALEAKAAEAQERMRARRNTLSANPFDTWADLSLIAAAKLARKSLTFADFTETMIREFGEDVRPYLERAYEQAKTIIGRESGSTPVGSKKNVKNAKVSAERAAKQAEREQDQATVENLVKVTRETIDKFKAGKATPEDVTALQDAAAEVGAILKDPKEVPESKQLAQVAKQLARKLEDAEYEKADRPQSVKDIQTLIRKITQIEQEIDPTMPRVKPDNSAIEKLAYELFDRAVPGNAEKVALRYIKENGNLSAAEIENIRKIAMEVSDMSGKEKVAHEMELQKLMNSFEKSSAWDKVNTIRYIAMLLNTSTQAVNALSGPMMATLGTAADILPTMVDSLMSATLKKPRHITTYGTNPLRFMGQWFKNAKIGAKAGWHGVNPEGIAGANDIRGLTFKSKMNPAGWLERSLGAVAKGADYGTYKTVQQSELRRSAYLDAKNKGVKGRDAVKRHIENFMANPTNEAVEQADKIARNTTFQRTDSLGGQLASGLAGLKGKRAVLKPAVGAITPFIRTPINIASSAVTMTPAGILKGLFQLTNRSEASTREALRTLGLGLTGTGLTALGYELSKAGIITGANDSGNKDVDAIREQAGRGKYRFNQSALQRYLSALINGEGIEGAEKAAKYQEGDKQFDYNKLQPIAFGLSLGAGLQEQKGGLKDKLIHAGESAAGSLFNMSTLKGVQDMVGSAFAETQGQKLIDPFKRVATSFLKSFSPSLLAQEARREDETQRKTSFNQGILQDTKDYFKSRTPGLSQSLPPNLTTLGQEKRNAPGIAGQYANPYKSDVAPYTKAAAFITELIDRTGNMKLAPSAPEKTVSGKDRLTREEVDRDIPPARYAQYQQDIGSEIKAKIEAIDPNLTDDQKVKSVLKIYEDVNTKYRNRMKKELGIRVSR